MANMFVSGPPVKGDDLVTDFMVTGVWREDENEPKPSTFTSASTSLSFWLTQMIADAPHVSAIFVKTGRTPTRGERMVRVWTTIDERTPEARREIYSSEQRIIDRFGGVVFDFCTSDRDPTGDSYTEIYRRAKP